ncbi:hypothetical protein [Candidatus Poriferisodalis sp.]|uniref:hypothetical protein n=1 Tax=Candidatus Poriferisodalis sp. TaxID=3101277 RepID=UPI003B02B07B
MGASRTTEFLIAFDHDARKQLSLEEYSDTAQALRAYGEREEQYRANPRVEVVLLGADSLDAIRVTHSNYFEDTVDALGHLCTDLGMDSSPKQHY